MSANATNETKLAPIFAFATNKCSDGKSGRQEVEKLKRKKKGPPKTLKTPKRTKHAKTAAAIGLKENEINAETECRRSQRLRHKAEDIDKVCYNEDTNDGINCDDNESAAEGVGKTHESVVAAVVEEDSITIDYWVDTSGGQQSTDDEIEIIGEDNGSSSRICSHEAVETVVSLEEQREYFLWTEKYKPQTSSEVIGHKVAVNRLKSWLEDWNDRQPDKQRRQTAVHSDNEDSEASDSLDDTNACLMICGPTGAGKTSLIYAVAEELRYEVLELNASMKRNGRIVSKILGEATQSHHMQKNKESSAQTSTNTIHSYFTSVANNSAKPLMNQMKSKKSKPKGILNYFAKQTNSVPKSAANGSELQIIEPKVDKNESKKLEASESVAANECATIFSPKVLSIATNSLILFDDIDVMVDEDLSGFWSAFNRIKAMTRKPVILTATQFVPYIQDCVNGLQILALNKPDATETVNALRSICDKEFSDNRQELSENYCKHLSHNYGNDIRRCINELQFRGSDYQGFHESDDSCDDLVVKSDINSYYSSLLLSDVLETNFKILSASQSRDHWMKCKPTFIEDNMQSAALAKVVINSLNELNDKIYSNYKTPEIQELDQLSDYESVRSISRYLAPNVSKRNVLLDYCPYIAFICESETIRRSVTANHSRKSRRFMHHLDSCGLYIDDTIKSQLMSVFSSQTKFASTLVSGEPEDTVPVIDIDFYD